MSKKMANANAATLTTRFGSTLVKDRIQAFYAKMNHALRELEAYKKLHGFCTAGISCMKKAISGNACAEHEKARRAGTRLRRWQAYESEYGKIRKVEIRKARASKSSTGSAKPRKKAA